MQFRLATPHEIAHGPENRQTGAAVPDATSQAGLGRQVLRRLEVANGIASFPRYEPMTRLEPDLDLRGDKSASDGLYPLVRHRVQVR